MSIVGLRNEMFMEVRLCENAVTLTEKVEALGCAMSVRLLVVSRRPLQFSRLCLVHNYLWGVADAGLPGLHFTPLSITLSRPIITGNLVL
jgi:hypothetical protein